MKRSAFSMIVYLGWLVLLTSPASAQVTRLNVGYSAISADQLPAWVAKETGIFTRNGLDVQLIFFTGGTTAILALVSGDVPITQVSGPGLVNSVLAGSDAVFVAARNDIVKLRFNGQAGSKDRRTTQGRDCRHKPLRFGDGFHRKIRSKKNRFDSGQGRNLGPSGKRP